MTRCNGSECTSSLNEEGNIQEIEFITSKESLRQKTAIVTYSIPSFLRNKIRYEIEIRPPQSGWYNVYFWGAVGGRLARHTVVTDPIPEGFQSEGFTSRYEPEKDALNIVFRESRKLS